MYFGRFDKNSVVVEFLLVYGCSGVILNDVEALRPHRSGGRRPSSPSALSARYGAVRQWRLVGRQPCEQPLCYESDERRNLSKK